MTLPVFLVEDDPALQRTLSSLIDQICDGTVVGTAESEEQAKAWIKQHPDDWQLAVLDLFLRKGTGFGVLESMPAAMRSRVIVLTNSANKENRAKCLRLGAQAVYDKTTELGEFLGRCRQHRLRST